jgi:hypothetical protein
VSGNSAELSSTNATNGFGPVAIAGGLHIQDNGSATITHTIVRDNRVTSRGTVADFVVAVAGGIDDDGSLVLSDSTVDRNQTSANAPASGAVALVGGAMDIDGFATVRDSRFIGNTGTGSAPAGRVIAGGGAIANFARTTLERTLVTGNSLIATGASGFVQGGGIWNGDPGDGRTPSLTLTDSTITANALFPSTGVVAQGGGLFTAFPATVTITRTVVEGNRPGQCFGC